MKTYQQRKKQSMWLEAKRADYEQRQPSRNTKQRERRRLKEADETRKRREVRLLSMVQSAVKIYGVCDVIRHNSLPSLSSFPRFAPLRPSSHIHTHTHIHTLLLHPAPTPH